MVSPEDDGNVRILDARPVATGEPVALNVETGIEVVRTALAETFGRLDGGVDVARPIIVEEIDVVHRLAVLEMIWSGRDDIILTVGNGTIKADMELLIMLITNLCDNAKKADATKINIDISERGISVKDNGKGIPQEDMKHIFEIFYQGDASRNQQGFGLGLALCQKIAALHNSRLCVESKLQEGSVFSLQFPYNSLMT